MAASIAFVTFGMFIIDEIEYLDDKGPQQNLIGGAGVYAALGARLAAGKPHSQSVSWIVDMGSDFPTQFKTLIDSWDTACVFRSDATRLTTRAWNGYGLNEHRDFKYLTPKIRLEVESLDDQQAASSSFHMVCSPSRCTDLTTKLRERKSGMQHSIPTPIIVWEPIPDLCTPEELSNLQEAAANVSIVSPNADELASFFRGSVDVAANVVLNQDQMVETFMGWSNHNEKDPLGENNLPTESGTLNTHAIIREGAHGSTIYLAPNTLSFSHHIDPDATTPPNSLSIPSHPSQDKPAKIAKIHLPAYHTPQTSHQVLDPTGGGNTYLGALAISMTTQLDETKTTRLIWEKIPALAPHQPYISSTGNAACKEKARRMSEVHRIITASIYAVIAASYAIEQCGVPSLQSQSQSQLHPDSSSEQTTSSTKSTTHLTSDNTRHDFEEQIENEEKWNGSTFYARLDTYLAREGGYISSQLNSLSHQ